MERMLREEVMNEMNRVIRTTNDLRRFLVTLAIVPLGAAVGLGGMEMLPKLDRLVGFRASDAGLFAAIVVCALGTACIMAAMCAILAAPYEAIRVWKHEAERHPERKRIVLLAALLAVVAVASMSAMTSLLTAALLAGLGVIVPAYEHIFADLFEQPLLGVKMIRYLPTDLAKPQ
ncbi:hypothetical protein HYV74_03290 [Candidatus Uhrbacteria bacterium]|nr:hypothetical protein [Candidatus Uhrbacteria bacterium]